MLGVSRNTVVLAYQGLLDDGYLVARERSGYYVSDKALESLPSHTLRPQANERRGDRSTADGPDWERPLQACGRRCSRTSPSRSTGRATPIPSSTARWTTISSRIAEWRDCARQALGPALARQLDQRHLGA